MTERTLGQIASEPVVMVVPNGSIAPEDKKRCTDAGIIVLETDNPSAVRFLKPCAEIESSNLFWAAMKAISRGNDLTTKSLFAHNMAKLAVCRNATLPEQKGEGE